MLVQLVKLIWQLLFAVTSTIFLKDLGVKWNFSSGNSTWHNCSRSVYTHTATTNFHPSNKHTDFQLSYRFAYRTISHNTEWI